jgi:hypothetical protein
LVESEAEVGSVELDGGGNVVDHVADANRGHRFLLLLFRLFMGLCLVALRLAVALGPCWLIIRTSSSCRLTTSSIVPLGRIRSLGWAGASAQAQKVWTKLPARNALAANRFATAARLLDKFSVPGLEGMAERARKISDGFRMAAAEGPGGRHLG